MSHVKTKRVVNQFLEDVIAGLQAEQKYISSKYFYDAAGDALFQKIMDAPEYYLTRSEEEILSQQTDAVLDALTGDADEFDLLELGAGDGTKTKFLLQRLIDQGRAPTYRPVDISQNALERLGASLKKEMPSVRFNGIQGEYFQALERSINEAGNRKVILFLGSNIGNLLRAKAVELLSKIASSMSEEDRLLVGFDLKKDPAIILAAYNDEAGHTRDFNLNLLHRINSELGGNIDTRLFMHAPVYDPKEGRALSYLVSKADQDIRLDGTNEVFHFRSWEALHTEISQKYDLYAIEGMARDAGLKMTKTFFDEKHYYTDVVFKKAMNADKK